MINFTKLQVKKITDILHTGHATVIIAINMIPFARIDMGRIPSLKNIVRINHIAFPCRQGITCHRSNIKVQLNTVHVLNRQE